MISPQEQLLLELVNRAREDPQAEAARHGISVEQTGFRAPLAPHQLLIDTAGAYSERMLDQDFFDHTDPDGNGPLDRVLASGYPANIVGENIAWRGTTGSVNATEFTFEIHRNLYLSSGHRAGMLDTRMREVGIGLRIGEFIDPRDGRRWNAMMATEVFATRTGGHFITGVAFTDAVVDDAFFTVGEQLADVTVTATNQTSGATFTTTTGPSGGYSLEVADGTYTVTFSGGGLPAPSVFQNVVVNGENRKIDFDRSNQRASSLPQNLIVASTDAGVSPEVRVLDAQTGLEWLSITPYGSGFRGGVRVATGDVNGDGVLDLITAPGPGGGPHVMAFDGRTGGTIASFFAYHPGFTSGLFVAAGDVDGDGRADIITAPDAGGGPHVRVFSGVDQQIITEFMAYSPFLFSGVRVAAGNVDASGFADIITAPGAGGGPHVRVFDGNTGEPLGAPSGSFFAYSPGFFGGIYVASADLNSDGRADIITAPGAGGGPHVRVFSGATGAELNGFFAYSPAFLGGVRVSASDVDNNGSPDILTSPGPGGGPHIRAFHGTQPIAISSGAASFLAFPGGMTAGVFVAGGRNQTLARIELFSDSAVPATFGETLSAAFLEPEAGEGEILGLPIRAIPSDQAISHNEDIAERPETSSRDRSVRQDIIALDDPRSLGADLDSVFADEFLLLEL